MSNSVETMNNAPCKQKNAGQDPLISVVVPVFNVEKYLPRCLEAIEQQTYNNLDIILVDDGSTDQSGALCDAFAQSDTRVRVIHQANEGLWSARNAGQRAAKGEFLFFPDADDYFHVEIIRLMYEAICQDGGYDFAVVGRKETFRADEDVFSEKDCQWKSYSQDELLEKLVGVFDSNLLSYMWNKLYRKTLIESLYSNPYPRSQDRDFNIRCCFNAKRAILTEAELYYWVHREDSLRKTPDALLLYNQCWVEMYCRNYQDYRNSGKDMHLFLKHLYRRMVVWRVLALETEDKRLVFHQCLNYMKQTFKDYIQEPKIAGIEKMGALLGLTFPRLFSRCRGIIARHPKLAHRYASFS